MEIKASIKNLRVGPRKVRLLTRDWRGQSPEKVISRLSLTVGKSTGALIKLLKQAIANAEKVHHLEKSDLRVSSIQVGDSFGYKRMDRSHGARFDRGMIKKRGSNVYLCLETTANKVDTNVNSDDNVTPKRKIILPIRQTAKNVNKLVKKNGSSR